MAPFVFEISALTIFEHVWGVEKSRCGPGRNPFWSLYVGAKKPDAACRYAERVRKGKPQSGPMDWGRFYGFGRTGLLDGPPRGISSAAIRDLLRR
jgi:hypothetical protein